MPLDEGVQAQAALAASRLAYHVLEDPRELLALFGMVPAGDDVAELEKAAADKRAGGPTVTANHAQIASLSEGMSWVCTAFALGPAHVAAGSPAAFTFQAMYERWFVAFGVALLASGEADGTLRPGPSA